MAKKTKIPRHLDCGPIFACSTKKWINMENKKDIQEYIDKAKAKLEKERAERKQRLIDYFNNMKPFKDYNDIPSLPVVDEETYQNVIIPNVIRCGGIPKDQLVVGAKYEGDCRNAHVAVWKENGRFEYMRTKFGCTYPEKINHFQDDDGYDVFVPIRKIEEN